MTNKFFITLTVTLLLYLVMCAQASGATLSPTLQSKLASLSDGANAGVVIVAFRTTNGLNPSHLNVLRAVGITGGKTLNQLGMVATTATVGQASSPAGVAVPEEVQGYFKTADVNVEEPADIQGNAAEQEIRTALANRRMDTFANNSFNPNGDVTREGFARSLALNIPVRQSLGAAPKFMDISPSFGPLAEAITARGSSLRDWNFTPHGLISASGSTFNPTGSVKRIDLAVAFVRALGLDVEARALANTTVTTGGQPLVDNAQIPGELRGYVQIAIDKGLLEAYPAEVRQIGPGQFIALPGPRVEPNAVISRGTLAAKLNLFTQRFIAGS